MKDVWNQINNSCRCFKIVNIANTVNILYGVINI